MDKSDWEEVNFEFNSSILVDGFPAMLQLADILSKEEPDGDDLAFVMGLIGKYGGIAVTRGARGSARAAAESFAAGRLEDSGAPCAGHGHAHGAGHAGGCVHE